VSAESAPARQDPHADWPDRTTLTDPSGELLLAYSASESLRDDTAWADGVWVPDGVPIDKAATVALDSMAGWVLSTSDDRLAMSLLSAGAQQRRHAHSMTCTLAGRSPDVAVPPGCGIEPLTPAQVDRHALRLGALHYRAYPAGHVDAFDGDEAGAVSQVRAIARGELLGPMSPESRVAIVDRQIVGACLVVDRPGEPPYGGPWVIDLFRDPDCPLKGIGAALLVAAMRAGAEAGLPGLSLVVTHGNDRAKRLYERLGFVEAEQGWTLLLPTPPQP
jgi:GNAT superfamily N-acetyltransferase